MPAVKSTHPTHAPKRQRISHLVSTARGRLVKRCLYAVLTLGLLACPAARAQDRAAPTLQLERLAPGGVRTTVTERWGTFDIRLTNPTDVDRSARVLLSYEGEPDVQYGRDVWVPARSSLATWLLAGPAAPQSSPRLRRLQVLLYDRTDGTDRLIPPPGEERLRSRMVNYRHDEQSTAVVVDLEPAAPRAVGQPPAPDSKTTEAVHLARTFRVAANLSEAVQVLSSGSLPMTAEGFAGIDHVILASARIADDPAGMRALRQWLEQGGRAWVLLHRLDPEILAPLLGDGLNFQVVGRDSLTTLDWKDTEAGRQESVPQEELPVDLARVLLPPAERVRITLNGWPAWFTRPVGRGKVVFTTVGPGALYRPRGDLDRPSPYQEFPKVPVPLEPLRQVAVELQRPAVEGAFTAEALRPLLAEEIGYTVISRGTAGLVFGGFLVATLALGVGLRRSPRPELLGWLAPAAALGGAAVFLALGEWSRRAPPMLAVTQVVAATSAADEVPVHGLLAVYRPDPGAAEPGTDRGGYFDLDMTGTEGRTRRFVVTDMDSWHWEDLALPAGVRLGQFHYTAAMVQPIAAVARLGPQGLEGRIAAGPFGGLADALIATPAGRNMSVRLRPDGSFSAGSEDILAPGHFLAEAVLSDRQQRRQDLYRDGLKAPAADRSDGGATLLAWADPIGVPFTLAKGARFAGSALLIMPLRLERPDAGTRVTIPGPLISCRRLVEATGPTALPHESVRGLDMHLRFQLPPAVLPFQVERARLAAKVNAPFRRVTVGGEADGVLVEQYRADNPLDPIRLDITDARLLRTDALGGLRIYLSVSEAAAGERGESAEGLQKWTIEYLELEVGGRVE
jgi:hypothetical protein